MGKRQLASPLLLSLYLEVKGWGLRGFPTPLAKGLPVVWTPLVSRLQELAARPIFTPLAGGYGVGAHPPNPLPGVLPLDPLFSHPHLLRVHQGFGSHSWVGFRRWLLATFYPSRRGVTRGEGQPLVRGQKRLISISAKGN